MYIVPNPVLLEFAQGFLANGICFMDNQSRAAQCTQPSNLSVLRQESLCSAGSNISRAFSAGSIVTVPKVSSDRYERLNLDVRSGRCKPANEAQAEGSACRGHRGAASSIRRQPALSGSSSRRPAPCVSKPILIADELGGDFQTGELPTAPSQRDLPEEYEIFDLTASHRPVVIAEPTNPSRVLYHVYPPTQPSTRSEVHSLESALEEMLQKAGPSTAKALEAWDLAFAELVRQVVAFLERWL